MRLRRTDQNGPGLRPIDAAPISQWDSALRSDYLYIDAPLGPEETFLNVDNIGYDSADVRFSPDAVTALNPYTLYGNPLSYDIVRSPAGVPVTNQDGALVSRYNIAATLLISTFNINSNLLKVSTPVPHGYVIGQTIVFNFTGAQSIYSGTYVIIDVPTTTTISVNYVAANLGSTGAVQPAFVYVAGVGAQSLAAGQSARVVDTGLLSGQFYYYGLFAQYQYQGNTYWMRVAHSELLVPFNFACGTKLWSLIPEYYRRLDDEQVGRTLTPGVLRRFIDTWGYELDVQRTWNATVGDFWDASRINARLLKQLGDVLGHGTDEQVLGDKRYRNLLGNLLYLRKLRGTKDGIEGWLQAATGYKILSYVGKNVMLSNNDTEFRASLGVLADSIQSVISVHSVVNKSLTSNVATLTTSDAHGFIVGEGVTVQGVDATFDVVNAACTAVSTTTFSYAKTAANVGSVAVAPSNPQALVFNTAYGAITRITSAGESGGPPSGAFYARYSQLPASGFEGHMRYGGASPGPSVNGVPVVGGHQYRFSAFVISGTASLNFIPRIEWYDAFANLISTTSDTPIAALTSWSQLSSNWLTAPAGATYAIPEGVMSTMATSGTYGMWRAMFTDRAWVPTGQVALYGDPSTAWESARTVHVSLYPQRTNYAVNAAFSQNSVIGWTATDPASYDTLPFAYATYTSIYNVTVTNKALTSNVATLTTATIHGLSIGDIVIVSGVDATFNGTFTVASVPSSTTFTYAKTATNVTSIASGGNVAGAPENTYNDLLAGFDTLSNSTTVTVTTAGLVTTYGVPGYMTIAPAGGATSVRASSAFFPVVQQTPFSARVLIRLQTGGPTSATVRLRMRWYTANNAGAEIVGSDQAGADVILANTYSSGASLVGGTSLIVANATPPPTAQWGRCIIEGAAASAFTLWVTYALIEDAPVPGTWFDGNTTESSIGDYRFTGTANQSFSAFYMNYNAVMNGLSTADRLHSLMPELVPPNLDYAIHTVSNGLL